MHAHACHTQKKIGITHAHVRTRRAGNANANVNVNAHLCQQTAKTPFPIHTYTHLQLTHTQAAHKHTHLLTDACICPLAERTHTCTLTGREQRHEVFTSLHHLATHACTRTRTFTGRNRRRNLEICAGNANTQNTHTHTGRKRRRARAARAEARSAALHVCRRAPRLRATQSSTWEGGSVRNSAQLPSSVIRTWERARACAMSALAHMHARVPSMWEAGRRMRSVCCCSSCLDAVQAQAYGCVRAGQCVHAYGSVHKCAHVSSVVARLV